MQTKERFRYTARLLSLCILLTAVVIRLGCEFFTAKEDTVVVALTTVGETFRAMPYEPSEPEKELTFSAEDANLVPILNWSGVQIDAASLIEQPLDFAISDEPLILIIHTHATEAYCNSENYRSEDREQNVVRIGQVLAERLNENGIKTLHETSLIDQSGYYDSYARSAELIEAYLEKYPSIQMVIDVHRDSASDESGAQVPLLAQVGQQEAAKLMLVMGTNTAGLEHPNWRENLSFALKLQAHCEKKESGVFRNLNLRSERYNQHLTAHSILLEVGAAGNTLEQAQTSVEFFADALTELLLGE